MAEFDWQNSAAMATVAVTVLYLARNAWKRVVSRKQGSCGGCGSCAASDATNVIDQPGMIEVESLVESAQRQQ